MENDRDTERERERERETERERERERDRREKEADRGEKFSEINLPTPCLVMVEIAVFTTLGWCDMPR